MIRGNPSRAVLEALGQADTPNKHHAVRWAYNGTVYRSKDEARFAQRLDLLQQLGEVTRWQRAGRYYLDINGSRCGWYTPDFEVWYADGRHELVEVKGWADRDFVFRTKVFRALYPGLVLSVVDGKGRPVDVSKAHTQNRKRKGVKAM